VLGLVIDKLAGGAHELPEALIRPCIEIDLGVDRKLPGFAERWTTSETGILGERRSHAGNAVGRAYIAGRIGSPHHCGLGFHVPILAVVVDYQSVRYLASRRNGKFVAAKYSKRQTFFGRVMSL
jgi:hypothetical protein